MSSFALESFQLWGQSGKSRKRMVNISSVTILHVECLDHQDLTVWGLGANYRYFCVATPMTFIHSVIRWQVLH